MESPPKRMTRARAAAKANEPAIKTTKIVTAAAKARSAPTASTRSTAAKRKTRPDDSDGEDDFAQEEVTVTRKATRGRPRKLADMGPSSGEAASTAKPTRGRPAKKQATETSKAEAAGPPKATRGRPRKVVEPEPKKLAPQPPKTTRARSGITSRAGAAKLAVKKTVTFEEPDKENMAPQDPKKGSKKEPATASIRGRPARRGGATAARSTRKTAKNSEQEPKKPLSPKKVTQMPMQRGDESEDELAGLDYSPVKPMQKSPVKPPSSVAPHPKKPDHAPEERDDDATITVNNAILNAPELGSTVFSSPARRVPSAMKDSMRSPARKIGAVPFPGSALKSATKPMGANTQAAASQSSLLMSAAKRPPSPIKGLDFGSPSKSQHMPSAMKSSILQSPAKRAMPGLKTLAESPRKEDILKMGGSPAMKPLVMSTPSQEAPRTPSEKLLMEHESPESENDAEDAEIFPEPIAKIRFPGRLSAVLPRDADPSLDEAEPSEDEEQNMELVDSAPGALDDDLAETPDDEQDGVEEEAFEKQAADPQSTMELAEPTDDPDVTMEEDGVAQEIVVALPPTPNQSTPQKSPSRTPNPNYQLRERDLDPCGDFDAESDSELLSPTKTLSTTPTVALFKTGTRRSTIGLTSLAEQFGSWSAGSPLKEPTPQIEHLETQSTQVTSLTAGQTPTVSHFFEEEMQSHSEAKGKETVASPTEPAVEEVEPVFEELDLKDEDFDLAKEAEEMSEMVPRKAEESSGGYSQDDTLSDASQEYGDENEMPIDPAILGPSAPAPVTPVRLQRHIFPHTTTKVPLKAADESTPSPLKKRAFSVARLPPQRSGGGLTRSVTTPSLSPSKSRRASGAPRRVSALPPTTPNKSNDVSAVYTPGTREDINPNLLRGAVVFVDVHTTEGADASGIFMELLTQMGARCRKTWDWHPGTPSNGDGLSNKVGITHIVYKDGGKRTLEKVRQTNGLVHCVGVSWVLDCERENEWLDESPYYIDTTLVPRGGARRRKSMEPKALTNMNGTLVDSSKSSGGGREVQTPNSSYNRRQSTAWMHTPSDKGSNQEEEEEDDDIEWSQFILTPVPKTPAPEAIAKYAAAIPETPSAGDDTCTSPMEESLMTRTCPPKARDMGQVLVDSSEPDGHLMRRLMAARRKSLQFAPKIGSPLSKTWR